jgi:O-antigen/teichoic acid export membrane protein
MTLFNSLLIKINKEIKSIIGKNGNTRSGKVKKNAITSFIVMILTNLISFLLMPIVLSYLDVTKYGIWLTINSVLAWVFLFDLGLSGGLRTRLAQALAKNEIEDANILINTSYAFLTVIMLILCLLYYLISPFVNWVKIFNAPSNLTNELNMLMMVVVLFFLLRFILQIINGIYTAIQKNSIINIMSLFTQLLSLVSILLFAKWINGSLFWIGFIYSISPLIVLIIGNIIFFNNYTNFKVSLKYIKLSALKRVLNIGIYEFMDQIAFIILMSATNLIIVQVTSPGAVVPYHVTMRIFGIFLTVYTLATNPLIPAFTEAYTIDDFLWIKNVFKKINQLFIICALGVILMIPLSKPIFNFLVKSKVQMSYSLTIIIVSLTLLRMFGAVYTKFLTGCGKVRLIGMSSIISATIYILFIVFFGKKLSFGIHDVLLLQLLLGIITTCIVFMQSKKVLNKQDTGIWSS